MDVGFPSLADPAAQANKLRKPTATAGETTQDTDLIRALVAEFNDRYMVVSEAGKVMLYEPDTDPLLKRRFYQRLDFADLPQNVAEPHCQDRRGQKGGAGIQPGCPALAAPP